MKTLEKKQLFWDIESVDAQKDAKFIIERVLVYGDEADFKWAENFYGSDKIKKIIRQSKNLDKKSFNFWRIFFNINKEQCILNQSPGQRSLFWKR